MMRVNADDLLSAPRGRPSKKPPLKELLRQVLPLDKEIAVDEIRQSVSDSGASWDTARTLKGEMNIHTVKHGKEWYWIRNHVKNHEDE